MDGEIFNNTPFSKVINEFKGKLLPSSQIESDYNNTLNYPNNYFIAPDKWKDSFYTASKKQMLLLSRGLENIIRVKPPFDKFTLVSLFQKVSNLDDVKDQYLVISTLTKELYLIGPSGLTDGIKLNDNTFFIDNSGLGLDYNWIVLAIADDEGCALVAEENKVGVYRGFFTNNLNLVLRCLNILNSNLPMESKIKF